MSAFQSQQENVCNRSMIGIPEDRISKQTELHYDFPNHEMKPSDVNVSANQPDEPMQIAEIAKSA